MDLLKDLPICLAVCLLRHNPQFFFCNSSIVHNLLFIFKLFRNNLRRFSLQKDPTKNSICQVLLYYSSFFAVFQYQPNEDYFPFSLFAVTVHRHFMPVHCNWILPMLLAFRIGKIRSHYLPKQFFGMKILPTKKVTISSNSS